MRGKLDSQTRGLCCTPSEHDEDIQRQFARCMLFVHNSANPRHATKSACRCLKGARGSRAGVACLSSSLRQALLTPVSRLGRLAMSFLELQSMAWGVTVEPGLAAGLCGGFALDTGVSRAGAAGLTLGRMRTRP